LLEQYRVDATIAGHVHSYYRTCPVYDSTCISDNYYSRSGLGANGWAAGNSEDAGVGSRAEAAASCNGPACSESQNTSNNSTVGSSSTSSSGRGVAFTRKMLDSSDTNKHKHGTVHFVIGSAGHKLSHVERGQEEWCQDAFETWGYGRFTVEGPESLLVEFVESESGEVLDRVRVQPSPLREQMCSNR
jgi:hypothetical protein